MNKNKLELGRLEEIDIRTLWAHEQYDFSEWISQEDNIELLNETIGLTLTEIQKEVAVGAYRCDLVGVDETTGIKVIVENQLESTNHDHLGKIITYASGLDADIVVWIVREAREEHRSAIEWLNNKTASEISFFLIEIHAYRIGESVAAPKFEIIEKPNDFTKSIKNMDSDRELNKSRSERLYFWTEFNKKIEDSKRPFNIRKATTNNWYDIALGTSEAHISITLVNKNNQIEVAVYIKDSKKLFDYLYARVEIIQEKIGFTMDWQRLDDKKASRIIYYINGLDFDNHNNYPELMDEIIEKVIKMREVFKEYIK